MNRRAALMLVALGVSTAVSPTLAAEGNSTRGQRVFNACAACHSLQPDQNMTGPSLAGLWNRKAGSVASFSRYSPALKSANIVWNDKTLDDWITDPQHLVPGNQMTFPGIKDARQRADLLAFLRGATQPRASAAQQGAPQEQPPAPQQFRVALGDSCQRDVPKTRSLQWAAWVLSASAPASFFTC